MAAPAFATAAGYGSTIPAGKGASSAMGGGGSGGGLFGQGIQNTVGRSMQILSMPFKLIGANKRRQAAKRAARELREANEQYIGGLESLSERLENAPELSIDESAMTEYLGRAEADVVNAQGRTIGEEAQRDSVRRTTADSISRARRSGSSTADILGFTAAASEDESRRMSDIDIRAARNRERRIGEAKARLGQAVRRKVDFNRWRDQALYNDRRRRFENKARLDQQIASARYGADKSLIAQRTAVKDSGAAMWDIFGDSVFEIGSGMVDSSNVQQETNELANG